MTASPRSWPGACATAALALFTTLAAQAQVPDREARTWAASCAACHGTDGRASKPVPPLAGRDTETLYRTLLEFKNGQRPAATVMHQHTKGYDDAQLRRIAQVFASRSAP